MSRLEIRRPHALTPEEARRRVAAAAEKLRERYGADCRWQGELLRIEHPKVHGSVAVLAAEVVVEARLGLPLALLRGRIEDELTRIIDRELARDA